MIFVYCFLPFLIWLLFLWLHCLDLDEKRNKNWDNINKLRNQDKQRKWESMIDDKEKTYNSNECRHEYVLEYGTITTQGKCPKCNKSIIKNHFTQSVNMV